MQSQTTTQFWKAFHKLPASVQDAARKNYHIWQHEPFNPKLKFKHIHPLKPIYSVRVGIGWRAVAIKDEHNVIWFWIGSHADYDHLISQL